MFERFLSITFYKIIPKILNFIDLISKVRTIIK